MERLLIKNIRYLYCMDEEDTFLENADIYIEGNVIKKIGTKLDVPADGVKVIDGTGKLALPGFINTHHHFYQNITRNIPIMQKGNLLEIFRMTELSLFLAVTQNVFSYPRRQSQ